MRVSQLLIRVRAKTVATALESTRWSSGFTPRGLLHFSGGKINTPGIRRGSFARKRPRRLGRPLGGPSCAVSQASPRPLAAHNLSGFVLRSESVLCEEADPRGMRGSRAPLRFSPRLDWVSR